MAKMLTESSSTQDLTWVPAPVVEGARETMPETPISFYLELVWRYRWRIVAFVVLTTAICTLVATTAPKQYQAVAVLRIDPAQSRTLGESGIDQNASVPEASRMITTEAREVTSPAVVAEVVQQLGLAQHPEFAPRHVSGAALALTPQQQDQVLKRVTEGIGVDQPLDTYLLRVSFRSRDPELSAKAANALLDGLIHHDSQTRVRALMNSTAAMRAQLTDLGAKMEKSQEDLVKYESTHDVLDPDSKTNIMQSRLGQTSKDLGVARAKRMALQADDAIVERGNLDALLASDDGAVLRPEYARWQNDQRTLSRLAQVYGPNHPLFRQQQALVQHDQQALRQQELHLASQTKFQYINALAYERLLANELAVQKGEMDEFNLKAIRYNSLKGAADNYTKLYFQLQQRIQDAEVAANLQTESLRVVSPAEPQWKPVAPRPVYTAVLAFLLSTLLGIGAAITYGAMDRTVSRAEDVERLFALPTLASLPAVTKRDRIATAPLAYGNGLLRVDGAVDHSASGGSTPFREGILTMHSAVLLAPGAAGIHSLAICSALPGEGKSTLSSNFAAAHAGLGNRTVLVDLDLRKSNLHRLFHIPNRRGLSGLLRGKNSLDEALVQIPSIPNLTLLPAGPSPASPAELLQMGLTDLLDQLRTRFDLVVFDCPPVLGFADMAVIAPQVDASLLVVQAGKTERQFVTGALRQLRSARAQILGIVLNGVSERHSSYYSYYSTDYAFEDGDRSDDQDRDAGPASA